VHVGSLSGTRPTAAARTHADVRPVETWAVGWLAVALWCVFAAVGPMGIDVDAVARAGVLAWVCLSVSAAHFVSSYPLAYGRSAREFGVVRAHPVALVWAPGLLAVAVVAVAALSVVSGPATAAPMISAGVTGVLVMTTWHAVKQVYGVGRLGAALAGIRLAASTARVLRFGLYPLWFSAVVSLLASQGRVYAGGYSAAAAILPAWAPPAARAVAVCSMIVVACTLMMVCRRARRTPGMLVAPYVAWSLWLLAPPAAAPFVILTGLHGLQYLVCVHRAEAADRLATGTLGSRAWWPQHVLSAAAVGVLILTWLPRTLDRLLGFDAEISQGIMVAATFVFLNTHHYLIDAVVWRSDGYHLHAILRPTRAGAGAPPAHAEPPAP
jgi:hypothetical protein